MAETKNQPRPLGHAGRPVRILNFAGGSFDTVMQLGVAHALLIIQGRAPDAIVGVSAGAIQAAAVAEILQAGEQFSLDPGQSEKELQDSYRSCQAARVQRFREFVNAAQRAPEELIDASLPDAYQIESYDALQPLRTARFVEEERDERERHLRVRSGLVRLYNHLLRIHVPVGTVTRVVRRWLGFQAADDMRSRSARWCVKALELFRIWLLIGAELHRLVTVAPMLVRPLFTTQTNARVATAGSLIFHFRAPRFLKLALIYSFTLFVLASTWVIVSTLPAVFAFWKLPQDVAWYWQVVAGLPYLLPLLMALAQWISRHDSVTRLGALRDGFKGLLQFAISLFIWGGLAYLLISDFRLPDSVRDIFDPRINPPNKIAGTIFLIGGGIGLATLIWAVYLFRRDRSRQANANQPKMSFKYWYGKRFLESYNLSRSLLHHHRLEKFLAELFDRDYYGRLQKEKALEAALETPTPKTARSGEPSGCFQGEKKIGDYCKSARKPRIALGLGVADVGSGKVEIMDDDASVVCGLRAATALVPLLPAVRYEGHLYTDSTNVTPVPMPAMLSLLRRYGVHKEASVIHVYRVAPVPFSKPRLRQARQSQPLLNLVDIALRAIKLRQYKDADLERRLIERYTRAIPSETPEGEFRCVMRAPLRGEQLDKEFFRMWVAPVELELPVGLNGRIMFADREQRRAEILRTIAQGCRASMQVMIADAVDKSRDIDQRGMTVPCAKAVQYHLEHCGRDDIDKHRIQSVACQRLPGSRPAVSGRQTKETHTPPGLWDICKYCQLDAETAEAQGARRDQTLVWQGWTQTAPSWPHEFEEREESGNDRHFETVSANSPNEEVLEALRRYWPRADASNNPPSPVTRPSVSLLFSGGVFRGVFQVGVLNALNVLRVKPDIVAGASIGSITAGMAAHFLATIDDDERRAMQLARLAGAYLAVDRIILTDRFADFVREFTIRAANTRFSLRQADQLFRKYDRLWTPNFDRGARQVIAGIERLLYLNFYQLNRLVRAMRNRQSKRAGALVRQFVQQWLSRMNVGEEVLGAEALEDLIQHFIGTADGVDYLTRGDSRLLASTFQRFIADGVLLLATTTDLTDGRLLTLGDPFSTSEKSTQIDLVQALLASSAFPGVFRPRWLPELFPQSHRSHQFIDGGVMDNLPIDAVVQLLLDTSHQEPGKELIKRRPFSCAGNKQQPVPHLAFAASLEPEVEPIELDADAALSALENYWPALNSRAKKLGYNNKLDNYSDAARDISALHDHFYNERDGTDEHVALDLEIVALKPKWLCGTFAFHPMLGYRRLRQAESIAHGCALTFLKFSEYPEAWLGAWGIDYSKLPKKGTTLVGAHDAWQSQRPNTTNGKCWLRPEGRCPYSHEALNELNSGMGDCIRRLDSQTIEELSLIYTRCQILKTHEEH